MKAIKRRLALIRDGRRRERATLPWSELEAEAARQGCSAADIFFDRAGRRAVPPEATAPSGAADTARHRDAERRPTHRLATREERT